MASESEQKPAQQAITLRVKEAEGTETMFKVKRSTKFEKIFAAFYQKKGVATGTYKFTYEGEAVEGGQSPDDLELEDQAQIDAIVAQTGGAARWSVEDGQ